ncbi:MAG: tyrosine-type recombinase/integrase, partial [Syntrophales bacterium]
QLDQENIYFPIPILINPCIGVDKMPTGESVKDIPSEEETLRLIAAARPGDERDLLMCCLHLLGRIDEILRLRWKEDINFEQRIVTLWTRKHRDGSYESNPMPMNYDLYDVLWSRWKKRSQEKWVFFNKKTGDRYYHRPRMMDSVCKRAGIESIGVRRIRLTPA